MKENKRNKRGSARPNSDIYVNLNKTNDVNKRENQKKIKKEQFENNSKVQSKNVKKKETQRIGSKNDSGQTRREKRPNPSAESLDYNNFKQINYNNDINESTKKSKIGLKKFGVGALAFGVLLGGVYLGASYYYSGHFFLGTTINGINVSNMSPYKVEKMLSDSVSHLNFNIVPRQFEPETIQAATLDYQYEPNGNIVALVKKQNPFAWIEYITKKQRLKAPLNASFNKEKLKEILKNMNFTKPENQVPPKDAYITLNGEDFTIVPDTEGATVDLKKTYKILSKAVANVEKNIDLNKYPDAYVKAAITSDNQNLIDTKNAFQNFTKARITYDFGDQHQVVDGNVIRGWLPTGENGQVAFDVNTFKQNVEAFVSELAKAHDTVGTTRQFKATDGRTVAVSGASSTYGWKIDQPSEVAQLMEDIKSGKQIEREPVYAMRANAYGQNDIGNTYIEVDMGRQVMYVYRDGQLLMSSNIVSGLLGDPNKATPPGIFKLYNKQSPSILRGVRPDGTEEYRTQVSYWMPFNGGIGFHDATWQPEFGGDRYCYAGSHGCINMPLGKAQELYGIIDSSYPIVCFY